MSTPATIPCLLYFAALFLTVATLWILLYADPNERSPRDFFVLSYAVCHADLLRAGCHNLRQHRCGRGWPTALPLPLSSVEALAAAVTYIGLSVWLWLRCANYESVKDGYRNDAPDRGEYRQAAGAFAQAVI